MQSTLYVFLFTLLPGCLLPIANIALAQGYCDCEEIVADCSGSVRSDGTLITISSNSQACSRIDYRINGEPQLTVFKDGSDQVEWLGAAKIESVDVQSCVVCKEWRSGSGSAGEPRSDAAGSSDVDPRDRLMLGMWRITPRTMKNQYDTQYQTGTITVTEKLASGRYNITGIAQNRTELKSGAEWSSGICVGSSTSVCNTTLNFNGILTISGSRVVIDYNNEGWASENLTLYGSMMQGVDASGPISIEKQ